jgi:hypothetical protein
VPSAQLIGGCLDGQITISSCISKYPPQNAMSCRQNFATMKTRQTPQTPRSENKPKRLEYRSPSVAKLGKLADLTLTVDLTGTADGGMGVMTKT